MFDTKSLIQKLEKVGVQPTAQRIAIYQYVMNQGDHPTAEEIKTWADDNFPKMSLATIYNTLRILVEANLLKEFKLPHSSKVVYDNNIREHHHFLDDETGQLIDLDPSLIQLQPKLVREFEVNAVHVLLRGKRRRKSP